MAKMTEAMKAEAVRAYFEEGEEAERIAERMGVQTWQVRSVLSNPKRREPYRRRAEAAKLRAQICVSESAEEAARKQAQLLREEDSRSSVSQRAAKDILDRAGIRTPRETRQKITITFAAGAPKLGMPRTMEESDGD